MTKLKNINNQIKKGSQMQKQKKKHCGLLL
jgi:hypothetical protein